MYKKSYFQGTEEPTPKKKKYKTEKAILVQPRFKEPFYRNYDLYETEGVNGKPKSGPGAGWHNMHKYKSIKEFRDVKRKHLEDKYKADDFYIEDTDSNRKKRIQKMKIRAKLISKIIKSAIDFAIDDQINDPIAWDSGSYIDGAQIGGHLDHALPLDDFEGKKPEELDFGRDYVDEPKPNVDKLINKYLSPKEPPMYGLPDGIEPIEDLDSPSDEQPQYGTTDSGNSSYNKMWI
jgi:hypothetical protein